MAKRLSYLTHPAFLIALFLLVINDFILKAAYPGLITGKLSDVAGLFVFTVFIWTLIGRGKGWIWLTTVILFVWWKSSFSQSFIDGWNTYSPLSLSRTIDLSDLWALLILPVSYIYKPKERTSSPMVQKGMLVISVFAIIASNSDDVRFMNPMTGNNEVALNGCKVTIVRSGKKDEHYTFTELSNKEYAVLHGKKDTLYKGEILYNDSLYYTNRQHPIYPDEYVIIQAFEISGDSIRNFQGLYSDKPYALVNTSEVEKKKWFRDVDVIWSEANEQNIVLINNTEAETRAAFKALLERAEWHSISCP